MKSNIAFLAAVQILLGLHVSAAGAVTVEHWPVSAMTIPEGDAYDTLGSFAGQSDIALQMPERPFRGIRTHAVTHERNPVRALQKMLAGTAFAFSVV